MSTTPGITGSTIGPGTWDCSQLARDQIEAVIEESSRARIVAEYLGEAAISSLDDARTKELARIAFHYARKVII